MDLGKSKSSSLIFNTKMMEGVLKDLDRGEGLNDDQLALFEAFHSVLKNNRILGETQTEKECNAIIAMNGIVVRVMCQEIIRLSKIENLVGFAKLLLESIEEYNTNNI